MVATTSVTDARTVVMVERLLSNGYTIRSQCQGKFAVTLHRDTEHATGDGETFPEALYAALKDLPRVAL